MKDTFLLRFGMAVVMFMHSVPSIVSGDVIAFGIEYLSPKGFGFLGLPVAIAVKLIHLFSIYTLLVNKHLKPTAILNILVLISGIVMVHAWEGWYVVGGGRNGIEFNFILIFVFLSFWFPKGIFRKEM
ncbi:DoxX family protein [Flavobacterium sp. GCM10027622]|uniref:DoxX family protein n=1 Tax=unclassified Flavobacterium TaxID=196869 RepID=UPI00361F37C4